MLDEVRSIYRKEIEEEISNLLWYGISRPPLGQGKA